MDGKGEIQIAAPEYPPHPAMLFPKERSTFAEDEDQFKNLRCYAHDELLESDDQYDHQLCPELEHTLDPNDVAYKTNPFAPLDAEDTLRSQYTYGTSPVQAIAGFYDPKYLIIGDGDMNKFEIVNWGKLLKDLEGNPKYYSCIQEGLRNRGFEKPLYSLMDRWDDQYPVKFYRQRYAPRRYYTSEEAVKHKKEKDYAETAIFEAIGLEDRLLLVTTVRFSNYNLYNNIIILYSSEIQLTSLSQVLQFP